MTKPEFIEKVESLGYEWHGTEEDYRTIELVYSFHPSIDEEYGKKQVAELYGLYGMLIFHDMLSTARRAERLEKDIREAREKYVALKEQYEDLRKGLI